MNKIQEAIFYGSKEESGIWEILNDVADLSDGDREAAFFLIQNEIGFILEREDIFFIKSLKLYDSDDCEILNPKILSELTINDVEFKENGPFYYFSNLPTI